MITILRSLWSTLKHLFFHKPETIQYPEQQPYLPPRFRGRIVLTKDPDGQLRCVACYLCAAVCPADCIALQATEGIETSDQREREGEAPAALPTGGGDASPYNDEDNRRYPEWFRINFSRCILCGLCEEACPTYAIQLTPDFDMVEYNRNSLVYEKEDLIVDGPGKYPGYNFYSVTGLELSWKKKGEGEGEKAPVDIKDLMP